MNEIQKSEVLLDQLSWLLKSGAYSDITFIVDLEKIPAHRVILATRSEYFRCLLYGGLAESHQSEITLNVPLTAFKEILNYIYSGRMALSDECLGEAFDLAHQYGIAELELGIIDKLTQKISLETVMWTRNLAKVYGLSKLLEDCDGFIDRNAESILKYKATFNTQTEDTLQTILGRDTFKAKELHIFLAVKEWCEYHPDANVSAILSHIRFPLIDLKDLVNTVWPTNLLDANTMMVAIQDHCNEKNLVPRVGTELPLPAVYIANEFIYDLKSVRLVNMIKAQLRGNPTESYYLEVSEDKNDWYCVVDYSKFRCSSHQRLHFATRSVRYIRFVSAKALNTFCFAGDEIKAVHTSRLVEIHDHIVAPIYNVTHPNMGAALNNNFNIENNDTRNDELNDGKIPIIVAYREFQLRLGQPYYINSIRIQFLSELPHNFSIETSANGNTWTMAVNNIQGIMDAWQHFTFTPRIIMYIRVKHNSISSQQYQCKLECPSEEPNYLKRRELQLLRNVLPL